jgi:hypothetical protein
MDTRLAEVLEAFKAAPAVVTPPPTDAPVPAAGPKKAPAAEKGKDRDPERLVKSLVAAINSGNAEIIRRFVSEEYAESALADGGVDARVEVYLSVHEEAGKIRLSEIEQDSENEIVAVVQSKLSLAWHRLEITRESTPPHKILVVNIDSV